VREDARMGLRLAAVDNGGDGAMCRAEVYRAIRHAGNAMGIADLADMIATAMAENRSKR
jgi:hypothetical protein